MAQPLVEVFGFPQSNHSADAVRHRNNKLCPFQPGSPPCTKVSVTSPLGVCTVSDGPGVAITCPTRFKENWDIAKDAAAFFFPAGATYKILPEIRIKSIDGSSAGNIDVVLAQLNPLGRMIDFGSIEIQAVYISGNVRDPFEFYMQSPQVNGPIGWLGAKYPRPDYLSSSRKRLAPQMIMKGGIFKAWGKKQAIALHKGFFNTLPALEEVPAGEESTADIAWFIYDLVPNPATGRLVLTKVRTLYTEFGSALASITTREAGSIEDFEAVLRRKL